MNQSTVAGIYMKYKSLVIGIYLVFFLSVGDDSRRVATDHSPRNVMNLDESAMLICSDLIRLTFAD